MSAVIFIICLVGAIYGLTSIISIDEHTTYRAESLHLYLYINFYMILFTLITYITIISHLIPIIEPINIFTLSEKYGGVRLVVLIIFELSVMWGTLLLLLCMNRFGTALYTLTTIFDFTSVGIILYVYLYKNNLPLTDSDFKYIEINPQNMLYQDQNTITYNQYNLSNIQSI
jgi:hypothetical protein